MKESANSTASKLSVDEERTPQFHILPKVHKPNIPGSFAVSSAKCYRSKFRDLFIPLKDTPDFINRITETKDINKDTILVTLDVQPVYTNIPNHEEMQGI